MGKILPNSVLFSIILKIRKKTISFGNTYIMNLKKEFGLVAYKSWLIRLKILGFKSNGELFLALPTEFLKDWVVGHYKKK